MMAKPMSAEELSVLQTLWTTGRELDCGQRIYQRIDSDRRPSWAADVLAHCATRTARVAEVDRVIAAARDRQRWALAHRLFSGVRHKTLEHKAKPTDPLLGALLYVAEIAAKVTFNESGKPARFDADSGHWLTKNLRHFCTVANDALFERAALDILVAPLAERVPWCERSK